MKIAIISDIHGNKTALEAVLSDIKSREIEQIFCLGDLIGKGPQGSECIKLVQENCHKVIRGNWDTFIQNPSDSEFIQWFQERLTDSDFKYLKSLPFSIDVELKGQLIRCFHASPRSEFERILPFHSSEKLLSMFEYSETLNEAAPDRSPDMIFYGDIHTTFMHTYKKGIICNVGSVGNSLDLTTASYAIIDGTSSFNSIQFVRVEYDREAELAIAEKLGLPDLEKYRDEILLGKYRNPK
ncbi:metallophosphoesterase family protein [Alkalihalobacillus sp. 1P02AB]|uniref:metallophosphoesterase family protein n=1 Tax=Alkalihalobacillus sp. 1P02AB TaxID=3132260 RepID=UPI0039A4ABA0